MSFRFTSEMHISLFDYYAVAVGYREEIFVTAL